MEGFGNQDAESLARIVTEPSAAEAIFQAEFQRVLGAFRNDGNIRLKVVQMLSLVRQGCPAVPHDDSHKEDGWKAITEDAE
jgi:hypothetical protein